MKVALVGDGFTDLYIEGSVERLSPEAPVPLLDVESKRVVPGGVLNVAQNLLGLGIVPTVFTITDLKADFPIVSPSDVLPLVKTRFAAEHHQLLRVDEPRVYRQEDLAKMEYPSPSEFDLVAFVDYCKGVVRGGRATIVDTKKKDLSVFAGSQVLKVNRKEWESASYTDHFPEAYVTMGSKGIVYYRRGVEINREENTAKEVIDVTGAGDTVMAVLIYCIVNGIDDPVERMALANRAAGYVVSKFGTAAITSDILSSLKHEH
jgi:D-beta-D-heptose 7-phosphate kinase/D-beta-D-heptose 1-phosphate adenosyltransferase